MGTALSTSNAGHLALPAELPPEMSSKKLIFMDGRMVPHDQATIHVSSAAAKYGSNVFEGICSYRSNRSGSSVFRLKEHLTRLHDSVRMMRIDCAYTDDDFASAVLETLKANEITGDAHIRLTVFVTADGYSDATGPASLVCTASPRKGATPASRAGHARVASWRRIDDTIIPPRIKAGANYHNSRFGMLEAKRDGYDEALFLTASGKVSEGANSCFAMVRDGSLVTPPVTASILESVTRATLLTLAKEELGIPVQERDIDRSELYVAQEAFLCGSGQEVRPLVSVDKLPVGNGQVGPITQRLWETYDNVVRGGSDKYQQWLTKL